MTGLFDQLSEALFNLEEERVMHLTLKGIEDGENPLEIIENGLAEGIRRIGEKFASGEFTLPHMVIGADIMQRAISTLEPALEETRQKRQFKAKVLIGTAEGDIHDIGKKIVATLLRANGYEVIDLGRDVPNDRFLEKTKKESPDFLCMSALMTTTVSNQQKVIQLLTNEGIRDSVRVIVGGAAVSLDSARTMGADGYAESASEGVAVITGMLE